MSDIESSIVQSYWSRWEWQCNSCWIKCWSCSGQRNNWYWTDPKGLGNCWKIFGETKEGAKQYIQELEKKGIRN